MNIHSFNNNNQGECCHFIEAFIIISIIKKKVEDENGIGVNKILACGGRIFQQKRCNKKITSKLSERKNVLNHKNSSLREQQ